MSLLDVDPVIDDIECERRTQEASQHDTRTAVEFDHRGEHEGQRQTVKVPIVLAYKPFQCTVPDPRGLRVMIYEITENVDVNHDWENL
jgi:hypothetical protein